MCPKKGIGTLLAIICLPSCSEDGLVYIYIYVCVCVLDVYDECEQFDQTTEDEGNEEGKAFKLLTHLLFAVFRFRLGC